VSTSRNTAQLSTIATATPGLTEFTTEAPRYTSWQDCFIGTTPSDALLATSDLSYVETQRQRAYAWLNLCLNDITRVNPAFGAKLMAKLMINLRITLIEYCVRWVSSNVSTSRLQRFRRTASGCLHIDLILLYGERSSRADKIGRLTMKELYESLSVPCLFIPFST
jgi:hypothetical protein